MPLLHIHAVVTHCAPLQGTAKEIEIVKLCERLDRFKSLAESGREGGERENAERMLDLTKEKLAALEAQ